MTKKIILTVLISASVFSFLNFGASAIGVSSSPPETPKTVVSSPLYLLKTYGETVGVYHYGEDIPFRLLDLTVSSLPEADLISLNDGIYLYSDRELFDIIEDLNS